MKAFTALFADELEVSYSDGDTKLTPDELATLMSRLLSDTLGDDPQLSDVIKIQGAMARAVNK